MIVRSQNLHDSIPLSRILRTKIEKKEEGVWLVTATVEGENRAIVLGRYPSEKEALLAETYMWITDTKEEELFYDFPAMHHRIEPDELIEQMNRERN